MEKWWGRLWKKKKKNRGKCEKRGGIVSYRINGGLEGNGGKRVGGRRVERSRDSEEIWDWGKKEEGDLWINWWEREEDRREKCNRK